VVQRGAPGAPPPHCASRQHRFSLQSPVRLPEQVVGVLKKEAMKTQSRELEKGAEYRQLLVQVCIACRETGAGAGWGWAAVLRQASGVVEAVWLLCRR